MSSLSPEIVIVVFVPRRAKKSSMEDHSRGCDDHSKRVHRLLFCWCCWLCSFLLLGFFVVADAQLQPQTRLSSRVEVAALYSLRSSLGLRSRDWPRKAEPCTRWVGVSCRNGHVVGLSISGLKRTRIGRLNPRFSVDGLLNLTSLSYFNASGFLLPGFIPEWFGRLGNLSVLDLRSCSVNGTIPASLGSTNLTIIDLSSNSLTGSIPSSSFSAHLSLVNLSHNSLTGAIPPQLGELSALVQLDLRFNSVSGGIPAEFRGLRSLQELLLSSNSFSGGISVEILNLPLLKVVALNSNNFSVVLPELTASRSFRIFDVSLNNLTGNLSDNSFFSSNSSLVQVFNISHNLFYGILSPQLGFVVQRSDSFDFSYNFFEGRIPAVLSSNATTNSSFKMNCLMDLPFQRTAEECSSFYAARGLVFIGFSTPPENSRQKNKYWKAILGGALGAVGLILLLVLLCVVFIRKYELKTGASEGYRSNENPVAVVSVARAPAPAGISLSLSSLGEAFTYEQLLRATTDFSSSNLIKNGHTGDIYRGNLDGRVPIVVKKITSSTVKSEAYMVELNVFGKASHTRLVPLLGHCLDNEDVKFLVYKYMPNGDLSNSLHRKATNAEDGIQSLDWITRLKIATGTAEALSYLHHEFTPPLVHRDVQASSILLDDKFEVRLGSLSEVCDQEGDAHQSVISRFLRFSQNAEPSTSVMPSTTCAYDVYCFGKVLLELVTGKLGISGSNDASTSKWLESMLPYININEKELVTKIIDPHLIIDEDLLEEVWAMAIVARSCLNPKPSKRPLMRYILKALENPLKVVREEPTNAYASARLRTTSSGGSWNAALFGSWRHSSSEIVAVPGLHREGNTSMKQAGTAGSQGSGQGGDRRLSREIFPEPASINDIDRLGA